MNPPPIRKPPVEAPEYTNVTVGLILFGALTVALGGLFLLLSVALVGTSKAQAQANGIPVRGGELLTNFLFCAGFGVTLIAGGIGSLFRRRWARTLLRVISVAVLMSLAVIFALLFFFLKDIVEMVASGFPNSGNPELTRVMIHVQAFRTLVVVAPIALSIPGIWAWFYSMRSTRLTCEAANPEPGWTDRVPFLVLAVSLGLALSAPMILLGALIHHGSLPLFGVALSGAAGGLVAFVLAGVLGYAAWAVYALKPSGWWIGTGVTVLIFVSSTLTLYHGDPVAMLKASGMSGDQVQRLAPAMQSLRPMMLWGSLLFHIPVLGTMAAIWRHFRTGTS